MSLLLDSLAFVFIFTLLALGLVVPALLAVGR